MADEKTTVKKSLSYEDITRKNYKVFDFEGDWKRHQGVLECAGSILIYGDSGHGKTTYAMAAAKELTQFEKVFYNTAEEGMRLSFKRSLMLNNMKSVKSKITFQKETYDEMVLRLRRKRQPKVVFVDSVQYCFRGKRVTDYYKLIEEFNNTLFVFISHIDKVGSPKGTVAQEIYWDCQNRILVKDFKAHIEKSRCGGDEVEPFVINEERAAARELKLLRKS
ncbi:putative ATP-dependent serine protease [Wenyingzhuangia heitensis]|uniref:ATP-dependent serine protease n=1 Tax=Wenyingzhuangia heitensis TaxID=1487859 RepID=A0ABX0U9J3_9FLAO|nr:AAA family ATPase [Wenyingzhuangia heitensis]NIJ45024.1 putative ATP-dependent serine protease [Wenyingzhuangia heitensis]